MRTPLKHDRRGLSAAAFVAMTVLCLLVLTAVRAEAAPLVTWADLKPSSEPYDDPFKTMPAARKADLRKILLAQMRATAGQSDAALDVAAKQARQRLEADGVDIAALLAQRQRIIERRQEAATGVTAKYLDDEILIDGYALPLTVGTGRVVEFLLVPWVAACIHTPPPAPNQIVHVSVPDGLQVSGLFEPVRLRGRLEYQPAAHELFLVDGTENIKVSYALTNAERGGTPGTITAPDTPLLGASSYERLMARVAYIFTSAMSAIRDDRSFTAIAPAILIAFAYGLFHTLGPGHGKAVVVSYFVGAGGSLGRGLLMGVRIAVVHVLSAIVVVFLLDFAVRQATGAAPSDYRLIRLGSYAVIIAIGSFMLWRAIRAVLDHRRAGNAAEHHTHAGHEHSHDHSHDHGHAHSSCAACNAAQARTSGGGWLAVAVGAIPCTGALLVMLFGLANDLIGPAIVMVAAISAGMALAMSGIGIAAILGRRWLERRMISGGTGQVRFELGAGLVGAASVFVIGLGLFTMTLASPSSTPATAGDRVAESTPFATYVGSSTGYEAQLGAYGPAPQ
ncbi:MAG: hypothetical protein C0606_05700 [Hyphomicrobiales bacterium]|nr:MAG: hypothetical protein C0606_05700 [Hyphomicrobiales bacterium]